MSPDETRRLIEAADGALVGVTEGPWAVVGPSNGGFAITSPKGWYLCQRSDWPSRAKESEANGEFIAYARTGVPALSAECARLRAENEAVSAEPNAEEVMTFCRSIGISPMTMGKDVSDALKAFLKARALLGGNADG